MKKEYNHRHANLDVLYDRMGSLDDPCVYCGQPSTGYDHVPPLHYAERVQDDITVFRKYPACRECNSALTGQLFLTLKARRKAVKDYIRKKYRSFLSMPAWSEEELAELDSRFAEEVRRASRFAEHIKRRVSFY
jgi:hypothetical protein